MRCRHLSTREPHYRITEPRHHDPPSDLHVNYKSPLIAWKASQASLESRKLGSVPEYASPYLLHFIGASHAK